MRQRSKFSLKAKILSLIVAVGLILGGLVNNPFLATENAPKSVEASASDYGLASNIQDGVILHCFNWKYNDIKSELASIAAAGFTSVQTSPAQVGVSSGIWYWLYQPLGFYIGTNDLGTKDELKSLCEEADKYGIKVIVDVVANHLAGDHSNIQGDLKAGYFWHTYGTVSNWADRYQVTYGEIGMPDLASENSYVQQVVANYVNELENIGVDGIRWDAAKHIQLPSEGCAFWSTVTNQGLYHYGEILVGPDDRSSGNEGLMKEYTNYMSVTDSTYGKTLRDSFASGQAPASYGNWAAKGISNNKLVYWGESHDTWSNGYDWGYSHGMSQNTIDRAYAVAASRNEITALYFSRPYSNVKQNIYAGQKGSTAFKSTEVAAINHFHNDMNGQADYYTTGSNCSVITREKGAVIVAGSGSNFYVSVPNGGSLAEPGTYYDKITGNKWNVTSSTISGTIGSTGIVVLYKEGFGGGTVVTPTPTPSAGTVYYKNTDNWSNVNAYYWSDSNKSMMSWPGTAMTNEGDGVYSIEVPEDAQYIIFNNGSSQTDDLTLQGADKIYENGVWSDYNNEDDPEPTPTPNPVEGNIFYQNTNNWSKVYAYYWSDSNTQMTTWPGVEMSEVASGIYGTTIPEDAQYIIFTNGSGSQTGDLTLPGLYKLYNNGNWSDYGSEEEDPTPDPVGNYIYYQNTNNWSKVYAYYWSDSNTQMTTWPGEAMTSVGSGVYSIEIPEDAQYIIFTNGSGTQTGDLTLQGMNKIYNNGSWSDYN
ncbi:MAG: starch-binding protein [Lachnospiraceae bacterium]|nr:starch-binding protein [Lachnospiraceae bacterium]